MKYLPAMQSFTRQLPIQQKADQSTAFLQALLIIKNIIIKTNTPIGKTHKRNIENLLTLLQPHVIERLLHHKICDNFSYP